MFKRNAIAIVALLALIIPSIAEAGRLSGKRSLSKTSYGYKIVKDVARAGKKSQRFEVRAGDCSANDGWSDCANNRERSEFRLKKDWKYGSDQWIGFSVFVPSDFRTSNKVKTTVGQIHQKGGPTGTAGGLPSFPPLMQLEMKGNRYFVNVHVLTGSAQNVKDTSKEFTLANISDMRGKWTDIVIHLNTAKGAQVLEVWANGQKKATMQNWIKFRPKSYYFKYGLYRSFVSRHGGPMPTQVIYVDEVKMGRSQNKVIVDENRPVD